MDNATQIHPYEPYRELTLGEVLRGIGEYVRHILRYWWLLLLVGLLFGAAFYWTESQTPTIFRAELTFIVNQEGSSGGGALAGILGQAGMGVAPGGTNSERVLEISKSRLIVQQVLLDSVEILGRRDKVAHHIMDVYQLPALWRSNGNEQWAGTRFTADSIDQLGRTERQVLMHLYSRVVFSADEESLADLQVQPIVGIFNLRTASINEELTHALAEKIFEHLSDFCIRKVTKGPRLTYQRLITRRDSVEEELRIAEYQIARQLDVSSGVLRYQDRVRNGELERNRQVLQALYGETMRNVAAAEFSLANITPFFAVIDRPYLPLKKSQPKPNQSGIIGIILGVFLTVTVLVVRKVIVDALKPATTDSVD